MGFDWSPIELDRTLARAAGQWRRWTLQVRSDSASEDLDDDPLATYRPATGSALFRELRELPAHDPLREPLQRWVYRLAEQRINAELWLRLERERRQPRELPDAPVNARVSIAEMVRRSLSDPPRRDRWMQLFLDRAAPVSTLTVELWQRRSEIARRMGLDEPRQMESAFAPVAPPPAARPGESLPPLVLPSPGAAPAALAKPPGLAELGLRVSKLTRDRMQELAPASPAELLGIGVGRDIPGDWPGRLTPQRMLDFFRDGDLLRSLELRPDPLPSALGAASFCRALGILGAAWLEALAPQDQPFVVAHDPYGLRRHEAAGLFALLPLNPRFLNRHLDVPRLATSDVQRRLAQLWLLDLAVAAVKLRLRSPALASERSFREEFRELTHQELGVSLPPTVAGALFRLEIEDEQSLVGRLLAVLRERELTEAHDEDWFRNPRAIEQLRAEAQRPPEVHAAPERVDAAVQEVGRRLDRLLR
jgi:hypothetical protein